MEDQYLMTKQEIYVKINEVVLNLKIDNLEKKSGFSEQTLYSYHIYKDFIFNNQNFSLFNFRRILVLLALFLAPIYYRIIQLTFVF